MERMAIFIDAGYLFAQGSVTLTGQTQKRHLLRLDPDKVIQALKALAVEKADYARLLRIYWYDGARAGEALTSEQASLARLDDVKLRLGFINSHGQQKGVDSLIVTDLIELARLKSIQEALLLSGDEDVRIGVQIAQNHGVRVHVLGLHPARGSQSQQLLQEADTTTEWFAETVSAFLTFLGSASDGSSASPVGEASSRAAREPSVETALDRAIRDWVKALAATEVETLTRYWATERGLPSDFDRNLLALCREATGRPLELDEKKQVRLLFRTLVKARSI